MRCLGGLAHFLGQFREKFPNNIVRREAVRVLCFEISLANHSALVNVEKSGMRHPPVHTFRFFIKDFETANDPRLGVGQQWKLDFMSLCKVREDSLSIVANRGQLDALSLELCFRVLQLHELRFAKWSPVR